MQIKKIAAMGILAFGVSGIAGVGVAQAGSPYCESNQVCIYENNDFGALLDARAPGVGTRNVSSSANDKMDSWENRTNSNAAWYHGANGQGTCRTMKALSEDNNINFLDSDRLTSWKTNGGC